jgi:hypothetical protein
MGCGAVISSAVANQTALLAAATGKSVDELDFKFNLWVEALPLYQKGLLKLPKRTSLVMSDAGAGYIEGDAATFAAADGVYYHVQTRPCDSGPQKNCFWGPRRNFLYTNS